MKMPSKTVFRFDSTPVLITLPEKSGAGSFRGRLEGTWETAPKGRRAFRFSSLNAALILEGAVLPGVADTFLQGIPLKLSPVALPRALKGAFGAVNAGSFDVKSRFIEGTMGFTFTLPPFGKNYGVFRTIGYAKRDGGVLAGAYATVIRGKLAGLILCCCGHRRRDGETTTTPQAVCAASIVPNLSGATNSGGAHTDFHKYENADGTMNEYQPSGPTGNNELGKTQGEYKNVEQYGGATVQAFFMKLEIIVSCNAPCEIVSVTRKYSTQPGNDGAAATDAPDNPKPHSIRKVSDQLWVVSDSPGLITPRPTNRVVHRKYTVTARIKAPGGAEYEISAEYTVKLETDAAGNLK